MSADSPHRSRSHNKTIGAPTTVSPQQVTDPTILDSVAGFINDVVPTAYNVPSDSKDQIQWVHFEQLDCDESTFSSKYDCDKNIPSPLIIVLGYTSGIQVWAIPANGEAVELLSWRHGNVRVLRFLPAPHIVGAKTKIDLFALKRPLVALCDSSTPGPHNCSLNVISLKGGEQVKLIKFKNPILDVLANSRSIVVTFNEKIAIFDAFSLEDRLTVTTCFISPGINPNPVALGNRWMAYAENKFISARRSSGGNEGEGVQSYTATVLHAAKSLGRGLRELGETVASSLTGNTHIKAGPVGVGAHGNNQADLPQKGIVTILDIESQNIDTTEKMYQPSAIIAHFMAHTEALVYLAFDPSGMLLLTADKRGHDFHLFRIHPHPAGSALASVHHLYILHRGDTSARVQDMTFAPDSRWATVSTLRGTTHVFPITPYGGNVGIRTHATPHVVNRMSRFHRSAGLTPEGRSNSPVSLFETPVNSNLPYHNPRLPPYPHPNVVHPLAQIRQPLYIQSSNSGPQRQSSGRQRLSSSSEENLHVALRVCAFFAPPRAWLDPVTPTRDVSISKHQTKAVEALFVMSGHGNLIQYDLDPHPIGSIPKEKLCDDTPIELTVSAKAQWILQREPNTSDTQLPLSIENLNLVSHDVPIYKSLQSNYADDQWLSQVEIVTHAGPHRRLWMGPQFTFKTYSTVSGSPMNIIDSQTIDIGRSKPVNMPLSSTHPILIESGSVSSCEPSPKLLDTYQRNFDEVGGAGELQLKEELADAMLESPGVRDGGGRCVIVSMKQHTTGVAKVVNPLGTVVTIQSNSDIELELPEDIVIHENCDEALFRPVVASKAVVFAEPNIITNALPETQTAIVESPFKSPRKFENKIKYLCSAVATNKKTNNQSEINIGVCEKAIKSVKAVNKNVGISGISAVEPSYKSNPLKNMLDFDFGTFKDTEKELLKSKQQICAFSDPFDDDLPEHVDFLTDNDKMAHKYQLPKPLDDTLLFRSDKDSTSSPSLTASLKKNIWHKNQCDYSFDDLSITADLVDEVNVEAKANNDKYQGLDISEVVPEEKQMSKKPRKPKTKLGVRLSLTKETEKPDIRKTEEAEPIKEIKKSWSSIASSTPKQSKSKDDTKQQTPEPNFDLDSHEEVKLVLPDGYEDDGWGKSENHAQEIDILKLDRSDDEKQENNSSQTETTESDDSSKAPALLIAMDTEEDSCQTEIGRAAGLQNASKSGNKKKPKKKRR